MTETSFEGMQLDLGAQMGELPNMLETQGQSSHQAAQQTTDVEMASSREKLPNQANEILVTPAPPTPSQSNASTQVASQMVSSGANTSIWAPEEEMVLSAGSHQQEPIQVSTNEAADALVQKTIASLTSAGNKAKGDQTWSLCPELAAVAATITAQFAKEQEEALITKRKPVSTGGRGQAKRAKLPVKQTYAATASGSTSQAKAKTSSTTPIQRGLVKGAQSPSQPLRAREEVPSTKRRATPVWRESEENHTVIVSCAGIDMDPKDLCTLIEVKLKPLAMRFDAKTTSFEVRIPDNISTDKVIDEGLEWNERIFPIERPYKPRDEFFELKLSGLPLEELKWVTDQIHSSLGGDEKVLRITPVYCMGSSAHCGEFVVAIKGKVEEMANVGRHTEIAGREVFVVWPGAKIVCTKCRQEGHLARVCQTPTAERYKRADQAKQTRFRPDYRRLQQNNWGPGLDRYGPSHQRKPQDTVQDRFHQDRLAHSNNQVHSGFEGQNRSGDYNLEWSKERVAEFRTDSEREEGWITHSNKRRKDKGKQKEGDKPAPKPKTAEQKAANKARYLREKTNKAARVAAAKIEAALAADSQPAATSSTQALPKANQKVQTGKEADKSLPVLSSKAPAGATAKVTSPSTMLTNKAPAGAFGKMTSTLTVPSPILLGSSTRLPPSPTLAPTQMEVEVTTTGTVPLLDPQAEHAPIFGRRRKQVTRIDWNTGKPLPPLNLMAKSTTSGSDTESEWEESDTPEARIQARRTLAALSTLEPMQLTQDPQQPTSSTSSTTTTTLGTTAPLAFAAAILPTRTRSGSKSGQ